MIAEMIKVSLVILLALTVTALLRRRSAALRHWVLAAALACAAVLPALELVAPAWDVRPSTEFGSLTALPGDVAPPALVATPAPSTWRPETMLMLLWIAGIAFSLLILFAGFTRLFWLTSRARAVEHPQWLEIVAALTREYGIARPVRLLQSEHPTLLVTWGLFRPTVILPAAAAQWTAARVRVVLGHELAHIRRFDWAVQIGAELLRSVYWFNPLVWIACRELRRESEHACDDAVLGLGVAGTDYANELVNLARGFRAHRRTWLPVSVAPAMARSSHFERRVRAMLNASLNRTPITRLACAIIVLALGAITVPIAGFGAAQSGPATFSGSLLDMHGRILPNEEILLTHANSGVIHQARSDQNARFRFDGLPAGDYELKANVPGFQSRYRITVQAGQSLERSVTLQLGAIQETISLRGDGAPSRPSQARPVVDISEFLNTPQQCPQHVGGCVQPPTKVRDVRPVIPEGRGSTSIVVLLEGMIGTDGFVKALHLIEPADLDFAKSAMDAINQWQFTPTRLNGVTVETAMRVTVNFNQ